jgi:hypothetical protein
VSDLFTALKVNGTTIPLAGAVVSTAARTVRIAYTATTVASVAFEFTTTHGSRHTFTVIGGEVLTSAVAPSWVPTGAGSITSITSEFSSYKLIVGMETLITFAFVAAGDFPSNNASELFSLAVNGTAMPLTGAGVSRSDRTVSVAYTATTVAPVTFRFSTSYGTSVAFTVASSDVALAVGDESTLVAGTTGLIHSYTKDGPSHTHIITKNEYFLEDYASNAVIVRPEYSSVMSTYESRIIGIPNRSNLRLTMIVDTGLIGVFGYNRGNRYIGTIGALRCKPGILPRYRSYDRTSLGFEYDDHVDSYPRVRVRIHDGSLGLFVASTADLSLPRNSGIVTLEVTMTLSNSGGFFTIYKGTTKTDVIGRTSIKDVDYTNSISRVTSFMSLVCGLRATVEMADQPFV